MMRTLFNNPRTLLATAATSAALIAGAGVAAVYAFGSDTTTVVRQVTVSGDAQPAATLRAPSPRSTSAARRRWSRSRSGTRARSRRRAPASSTTTQGHVITNQHVVDGAKSVEVTFWNGKTYDATVVGSDPSTDIAVLDVDAPASALEPLALADSSQLEVGDGVVAIGSPFGLEQTVTTGIVSALHRQITAPNNFAIDDAIQTDAAINHGNSGGPLLDLDGNVVGVNSQIESESGGNDGVGFAVPSDTVERIADALITDGSVEHAYLGVATEDVEGSTGAGISEVRTGTPAAAAGLSNGDAVTKIDGTSRDSADELRRLIDAKQPRRQRGAHRPPRRRRQ